MAYEVSDSIEIAATPAKVWAVLADLGNYSQWHPAYTAVTGQLAVGSTLTISTTSPSTGNPIKLKVTVETVEPGAELGWASKVLGFTTINRRFLLSPSGDGTVLVQAGTYRGLGGSRGTGQRPQDGQQDQGQLRRDQPGRQTPGRGSLRSADRAAGFLALPTMSL